MSIRGLENNEENIQKWAGTFVHLVTLSRREVSDILVADLHSS